jgi:hypothetical protein
MIPPDEKNLSRKQSVQSQRATSNSNGFYFLDLLKKKKKFSNKKYLLKYF